MMHFDLCKLIQEGNRREKTFWQSAAAAVAVIQGESITVISPDENTAKYFLDQVKKRLKEHDRLFEAD
jgi:hypothetical protein